MKHNINRTKGLRGALFAILPLLLTCVLLLARSTYVWGPMASIFNNELKDIYANHTRLIQVKRNGDLKIEGEITQYSQRNKSVSSEGYSAQTELSITVNVRFTNNKNHSEDFERQFTASQSYETTRSLSSVQEELVNKYLMPQWLIGNKERRN